MKAYICDACGEVFSPVQTYHVTYVIRDSLHDLDHASKHVCGECLRTGALKIQLERVEEPRA